MASEPSAVHIARRALLGLALGACLAALTGLVPAADLPLFPPGLNAPAKPAMMPAFELPTTAGPPARSDALRGQVVIVRYWASW